ncbi:MAG: DUF2948 family protein [Caulobacteraceae bacterium]|nr:DUF2948 family protein [Caulobacteraceae bacterium]
MAQSAPPLKLLAQDADDLKVLSAALQDAVGKVGDIAFEARKRQLTIALNRFRWESSGPRERVRSAVQVGGVMAVKARKIRREAKRAVIELLAVTFEAGEAPGGAVIFEFAGGADLRCEVECLDVVLADVSQPWPAVAEPTHQGAGG